LEFRRVLFRSYARQLPVELAANHETAALRSEIVAGDGASRVATARTRTSARGAGVDQPEGPRARAVVEGGRSGFACNCRARSRFFPNPTVSLFAFSGR